jgi:hypothetical protein
VSWKIVRPQIVTLLKTSSLLQEVASTPKVQFSGYPAAHVVPSENSGDYETTAENERQYAWTIRVFYETKSGGVEAAYNALEEVVDAIIDLFDKEDLSISRTVGVGLPSNYTYLNMFAAPSRWGELQDLNLVMAEIIIKLKISIDVT